MSQEIRNPGSQISRAIFAGCGVLSQVSEEISEPFSASDKGIVGTDKALGVTSKDSLAPKKALSAAQKPSLVARKVRVAPKHFNIHFSKAETLTAETPKVECRCQTDCVRGLLRLSAISSSSRFMRDRR